MFVLIGVREGDYGDFYQGYRESLAVAKTEKVLEDWKKRKLTEGEAGYLEFVEFEIEEVPLIEPPAGECVLVNALFSPFEDLIPAGCPLQYPFCRQRIGVECDHYAGVVGQRMNYLKVRCAAPPKDKGE